MFPTILSTKYGRYKTNQDDLATFLAVTGSLCGAPATLTRPANASSDNAKSSRPKGKDRKLAKQRAVGGAIDESARQRAPKLALGSYIPLAEIIAKSSSVHGRIPKWVVTVIDKIISDREDCFRHINGEDVTVFLAKGQQDGHIHPINVLGRVRSILVPKYNEQVATAQNEIQPRTPYKKVLGETSGNANARNPANMFAELRLKTPESSPSSNGDYNEQSPAPEAEDMEKADAWRTSLTPYQVFAAYPEASRDEAWLALGSLRDDMMSIRRTVLEQWIGWQNGTVDLAAAAVTTNTAIDLVRSLEKQARPVIESYIKSLEAKETQLPVYWYSLGSWIKDVNGKTCGTNIYARLLGTDTDSQAMHPPDFGAHDIAKAEGQETDEWLSDSQSFRWAYMLVQLYCSEFFTKTNPAFRRPPGHEPVRLGHGARPDDARLLEQVRTCRGEDIQWLYELSFLGNYGVGPVFPFLDEVSRGFRIMHEDVDIKLWAIFVVQLFWDLRQMLGENTRSQPLHALKSFLRGGLDLFQMAEELYTGILGVQSGQDVGGKINDPVKAAEQGYTVITCLLPERVDEEMQEMGHISYPNLNKCYLMSQHPILCGILLHTARLMIQEYGIAVETCTRSIMKMAHFHNACNTHSLIKATWFDLEYCMTELQGSNLFMSGKPPGKETENGFGKAFLFAVGAMSLAYTAPDCRDRKGKRGRKLAEEQVKSRKNSQGKVLQKLGPVSLMFEDRFCRAGDRYELNEEDLQSITERAAAYKGGNTDKYSRTTASRTPRPCAGKPKSIAQLLADLSLGLDQEVLRISFPYICLNIECSSVLLKLEAELRSTHRDLLDGENMPPRFGVVSLHLLAGHSDKLWIAADEIHRYVGDDKSLESTNGFAGAEWMMQSIREPLKATIREKMRESARKVSSERHEDISLGVGLLKDNLVFEQQQDSRQEPSCAEDGHGRVAMKRTAAAGGKEDQYLPELVPSPLSELEVGN